MNLTKLAAGAIALACAVTLYAAAPFAAADGGGGGISNGMPERTNGMPAGHRDHRRQQQASQVDAQAAYQAGVAAVNAHNYPEAVTQFRTALTVLPDNGTINYALGVALLGNNQKPDARDAFLHAVRADDAPVAASLQLGLVSLELGDRNAAVAQQTSLQQRLTACAAPACTDATHAQLQAALNQLTHALEAQPAAAQAPAADPATTGWNFPSVQEGRLAYADAVQLINQERYGDALVALNRAQAAVGPHPDVLNYMGFANRHLGRFDQAIAYYHEALRLDPNHLGANEYLGELYLQLGDVPNARRQLARLDRLCAYGCAQREELAHWIQVASN
jgi:tetratricopeptide (TPR) repeat protein